MPSLACCYTDDETSFCSSRRFETLPMCKKHTTEVIRTAILDALMPWDAMREIVKHTEQMIAMHQLAERFQDHHNASERKAALQEQAERNKRKLGVVYYVRLSGDRIKIGRTINLKLRMKALRVQNYDVLAAEPGGAGREAERHAEFEHLRHGRLEDFDAGPDLLEHVEEIRQRWGNPWTVAS